MLGCPVGAGTGTLEGKGVDVGTGVVLGTDVDALEELGVGAGMGTAEGPGVGARTGTIVGDGTIVGVWAPAPESAAISTARLEIL